VVKCNVSNVKNIYSFINNAVIERKKECHVVCDIQVSDFFNKFD